MKKLALMLLLTGGAATLSGCVPAAGYITVTPQLVKVSEAVGPGGTVVVQGRYLGGPTTAAVRLGADEDGRGGYLVPAASVVSWTDSRIEFKMPSGAPAGGGWLFVEVAGRQSTGLPFSVRAN